LPIHFAIITANPKITTIEKYETESCRDNAKTLMFDNFLISPQKKSRVYMVMPLAEKFRFDKSESIAFD